jgi:hypothetical protein
MRRRVGTNWLQAVRCTAPLKHPVIELCFPEINKARLTFISPVFCRRIIDRRCAARCRFQQLVLSLISV